MNFLKHTAGPWSVTAGNLIRVMSPDNNSICGVHRRGIGTGVYNVEEVLANAHLIKASPDLLIVAIVDLIFSEIGYTETARRQLAEYGITNLPALTTEFANWQRSIRMQAIHRAGVVDR